MRFITVFLAYTLAFPAFAETPPLQRYLSSLHLGDVLDDVKEVYPPKEQWRKIAEPKGGVARVELERSNAKSFPGDVSVMRLRFRWGRLAHIQLIYEKEYSRRKPLADLVVGHSLIYGEPRRAGESYFWRDSRTVLRASQVEFPAPDGKGTELRVSLEVMNKSLFKPYE